MDAPTLSEFTDLFSIPPVCCPGFPDDLQHNHARFQTWANRATDAQRTALWVLVKRWLLVGASAYATGTHDDRGLRIGVRTPAAAEADAVYARIRFPENEEPWVDLYASTIEKTRFPEHLRVNLFAGRADCLSPLLQNHADGLLRLVRRSELMKQLADDNLPYNHIETRRRLAHRLPCSHPVGGLVGGSAAAAWRDAWKSALLTRFPDRRAV